MDAVFRALADPTRRTLLDELFAQDGQTLSALEERLPMTRFGVMKHLKVLEEAGLVTTKRRGREKLHFLNPVPIRLVHDRWVSKYAEPWAAALTGLKRGLESESAERTFELYIRTTPERLWHAITDGETRRLCTAGVEVRSDWTPGSRYELIGPDGAWAEGENVEVDSPRRLVQTFTPLWSEDVRRAGSSRVTWEISAAGGTCLLRLVHAELRQDLAAEVAGGWTKLLSGLKTLLETGEPLTPSA
jgi:uncharacterized protein YndB with AHSA1/START domain